MSSHMIRGRQLSRDTEHRAAIRRNMAQSLFEHGKIRTTLPKAKEVRAFVEKLITLARTDSVNNRRRVTQLMHDRRLVDDQQEFTGEKVVQKLFKDVAPKFAGRDGGYTRIIKLSDYRIGDGGSLVILQLLTEESKPTVHRPPHLLPAFVASAMSANTNSLRGFLKPAQERVAKPRLRRKLPLPPAILRPPELKPFVGSRCIDQEARPVSGRASLLRITFLFVRCLSLCDTADRVRTRIE